MNTDQAESRNGIPGLFIGIAWLLGSCCLFTVSTVLCINYDVSLFNLHGYHLGNTIGSLTAVVSAILCSKYRWHQINGAELSLYWLGGSLGTVIALTHISHSFYFLSKYIFEDACLGLFSGIVIAHITLAILIKKRGRQISIPELLIYKLGSLVGILVLCDVIYQIVLIRWWGFLDDVPGTVFRLSYALMVVLLMTISVSSHVKRIKKKHGRL